MEDLKFIVGQTEAGGFLKIGSRLAGVTLMVKKA